MFDLGPVTKIQKINLKGMLTGTMEGTLRVNPKILQLPCSTCESSWFLLLKSVQALDHWQWFSSLISAGIGLMYNSKGRSTGCLPRKESPVVNDEKSV